MKENENKESNSITMEKQYVNIENMTDSEFISWLYLERDREESIRNNPGWNNWVLVAALISIICFMYSILIQKYNLDVYKSIIFSSWIITILIFIKPFLAIVKVKRAIDFKRIRELKDEAPILDSCYIIFVSIIYSFIVIFKESSFIDILHYWPWMTLACLYSISLVYVAINKHKIAPALEKMNLFPSRKISFAFNWVIIGIANFANHSSKKELPNFYSKEFVLGIVFATILVLFYILLKVNFSGGEKIHIDELIDKVVYNKYSRNKAYRKIQTIRLGYLPVDYLKSEVERLNELYKECQNSISILEQTIDKIYKQNIYSPKLFDNTSKSMNDTNNLCLSYLKSGKHLKKKLTEMSINKYAIIDPSLLQLVKSVDDNISDHEICINLFSEQITKFQLYIEQYKCKKNNILCDKKDCKQRNQDYQNTKKIEC